MTEDHNISLPEKVEPGDLLMVMDVHEMIANAREARRRLAEMSDEEIDLGIRMAQFRRWVEQNRHD